MFLSFWSKQIELHDFRSCRELDTLLVSINKQIYQFQTFPEITGVTPSSGSTDGGTDLTIAGNYFTGTMENTKVYIAGKSMQPNVN